jgi:hypothetical protein
MGNTTYVKNIKFDRGHEVGRIYHVYQYEDGTHYSSDNRGIGQGGYISNTINVHFEPSTKEEYEKQNERDKKIFWPSEMAKCKASPYYFATKYLSVNGKPFSTKYTQSEFNKRFFKLCNNENTYP